MKAHLAEGWYIALPSSKIGRKPRELDLFGRQLVAWRDGAGRASIMPRHCPHLGASLAIGKVVDGAWAMATNQDILYPGAVGKPLPLAGRVLQRYVDRLVRTATTEAEVTRAFLDAFTLSAPMANLVSPKVMWATMRGPRSEVSPEPTLTADERERVTSAE